MNLRTTHTVYTRQECGSERCRSAARIYEHLQKLGMNGQTIADSLGVTRARVSQVITGKSHSPHILDALRAAGVPERLLHDPRRVNAAGKEAA